MEQKALIDYKARALGLGPWWSTLWIGLCIHPNPGLFFSFSLYVEFWIVFQIQSRTKKKKKKKTQRKPIKKKKKKHTHTHTQRKENSPRAENRNPENATQDRQFGEEEIETFGLGQCQPVLFLFFRNFRPCLILNINSLKLKPKKQ